jgi:hypothetical protein
LAGDRLEAALEATCDALIELQLIRTVGGNEVNAHANLAIDSLRRAIVELRAGRGEQPSALAPGFVTGDPRDGSREVPAVTGQSNP